MINCVIWAVGFLYNNSKTLGAKCFYDLKKEANRL